MPKLCNKMLWLCDSDNYFASRLTQQMTKAVTRMMEIRKLFFFAFLKTLRRWLIILVGFCSFGRLLLFCRREELNMHLSDHFLCDDTGCARTNKSFSFSALILYSKKKCKRILSSYNCLTKDE